MGWSDDVWLAGFVLGLLRLFVVPEIKLKTEESLRDWFGSADTKSETIDIDSDDYYIEDEDADE